ncbi:SGNH/GDSL hydrolase family protein [Halobaculum sp. MBLA0143]|uniref:SGNH/GDSL hydrolase family protein n=1 Tax=Halobaculum sp. MBLA0143 TaxID=3079933 RepID=UPI003523583C
MSSSFDALAVLGDSVAAGSYTDATGWPSRLSECDALSGTSVHRFGSTATTLAEHAETVEEHLAETVAAVDTAEPRLCVVVHAGHNDAQLSDGAPRVSEGEFRHAAAELDRTLANHDAVGWHGFLGVVPLLSVTGGVGFDDAQPGRSLLYDDAIHATVADHRAVARPVEAWHDRTTDGVHPNEAGHEHLAAVVTEWVDDAA